MQQFLMENDIGITCPTYVLYGSTILGAKLKGNLELGNRVMQEIQTPDQKVIMSGPFVLGSK
jgi:hypothetical protein